MFPPLRFSAARVSADFLVTLMVAFVFGTATMNVYATNPVRGIDRTLSGTIYRNVGGTMEPAPNVPLMLTTKSLLRNSSNQEEILDSRVYYVSSDSLGRYGPILVPCYYDDSAGSQWNANIDTTTLPVGYFTNSGSGGGQSCLNPGAIEVNYNIDTPAVDRANVGPDCNSVGRPVNVTNGNLWLQHSDYALPSTTLPFGIVRTYNSSIQQSGRFGFGWSSELDQHVEHYLTDSFQYIILRHADGRGVVFTNFLSSNVNSFQSVSTQDPAGLTRETDGSYVMTAKNGSTKRYYPSGKLHWKRDRNLNQVTFNYSGADGTGTVDSITDSIGRSVSISYNTAGNVSSISDSMGLIASYDYFDGNGRLKTVTYADGSKFKFEYDVMSSPGKVLLKTVRDALDNIVETHDFDSFGRATSSKVGTNGTQENYTLNYANWNATVPYTEVTDGLNRVSRFFFDTSKGRYVITKTEGLCGCGGGGNESMRYEYDGRLNLVKKYDADNNLTTYTYDDSKNKLTETDVFGMQKWTYNSFGQVLTYQDRIDSAVTPTPVNTLVNTYDSAGNLKTSTNSLGHVTTINYPTTNNKGLPESIKDARNNSTKFKWFSASGLLQEIEDAAGKKTTFTYDARGRTRSTTNPLTETTLIDYFDSYIDTEDNLPRSRVEVTYPNSEKMTYRFDRRRLMDKVIDDRGKATKYEYDSVYRLTKITDPLLHIKEFDYDLMSNLKWYKDALGNQTDFKYDDFNRLKEVEYPAATTGAARLIEKYKYDLLGRIEQVTDTANRITTYSYNEELRKNTITNPLLETTAIEYDKRFLTTKVTDARPAPNAQVYDFGYDEIGRLISETRAGTSRFYEYDEVNNLKKRTDHSGRISNYTYDTLNRLTKIEYDGGANNPLPKLQSTYGYDYLSRLTNATNESGTVTFGYDSRGRINATTDVFGQSITYEYERTSSANQKRLKLNGSLYASYNYDDDNRLLNILNAADSTTISYTYYADDRPWTRTYPNGVSTTYLFDNMRRIKRLTDNGPSGTLFDREYGYNSANQISQITEPSSTRLFGYDNADRLTSVTGSATENYVYDKVGNRESSHLSSSYVNALFNRVTSTQSATYGYDANGSTTLKSEGKELWRYNWDHENKLTTASTRKSSVRYKYDALGRRVQRIAGYSKENTKYTYEGDDVLIDNDDGTVTKYLNGPGIDNKLRSTTGSSTSYFLADHLGSTNGLTNSSGALVASNGYDSFGNPTNSSFPTRYQFTGREFDNFTGLQYSRARFYDPKIGRFISEDPIGFAGGDVNLYGYVWSDPISFTDPTGHFPSLWRFDYHADITRHGLKGFASPDQIEAIANENGAFDRRTQDPIYAPYHAMTRPGQNPGEAKAEANDFVRRKICEARRLAMLGDEGGALNALAHAIHALQDSHSPAHSGFQEAWPDDPASIAENFPHYITETLLPGRANLNAAEKSTRQAWRYYKGEPMPTNFFAH